MNMSAIVRLMAQSLFVKRMDSDAFADLLEHREPLEGGHEPEGRIVYSGVSWERYLALEKARGDDCSTPRLYHLDGELELMTTSGEHERISRMLNGFMEIYFEEASIQIIPRGQATMRLMALDQAGAEPDESWCIGDEKEFPDLVLEIALTSGGIPKLELYRRFAVSEVWFWRQGHLEIYALRADGKDYEGTALKSGLLPGLDIALLERCVAIRDWLEARRTFRAGLADRH